MDLLKAICQFVEAKKEYDKAYEAYDGYSWDWAGHDVIEALAEARSKAETALNDIIDQRIAAALANLPKQGPKTLTFYK